MKRGRIVAVASLVFGASLAIGCGSSAGDSEFGPNGGPGSSDLKSGEGFAPNGGASGGASGASSTGGASSVGHVSPDAACATSNAGVELLPVYLVFMFDRSGSMAQSSKWTSSVAGLKGFFGDPSSTGIQASMAFFRQADECNAAAYATPAVAMQALPDTTTFAAQLDATGPSGGTPTLPALQGAIQYAQSVKATLTKGEKVAIVLVTDGDPNDCSTTPKNTAQAAAEVGAAAATVAGTIPTYVIGVGPDAANLNAIASGGGTGSAIMIATSNPAQITADLQSAIGKIKASQLGCDYALPAPPPGKTLDVNAVNVDYTPGGGGAQQTLGYSATCSDANGWHYDNTAAPSRIVMCPTACSTLQADTAGGKVDIIFGCATAVPPGGTPPGGPPK